MRFKAVMKTGTKKARSWSLTTKASEVATGDTQERVFAFVPK